MSEDDGSPDSREAENEGGEGFYIAQSGRRADLLVIRGVGGKGLRNWNLKVRWDCWRRPGESSE